jgi:hypothetical protein
LVAATILTACIVSLLIGVMVICTKTLKYYSEKVQSEGFYYTESVNSEVVNGTESVAKPIVNSSNVNEDRGMHMDGDAPIKTIIAIIICAVLGGIAYRTNKNKVDSREDNESVKDCG